MSGEKLKQKKRLLKHLASKRCKKIIHFSLLLLSSVAAAAAFGGIETKCHIAREKCVSETPPPHLPHCFDTFFAQKKHFNMADVTPWGGPAFLIVAGLLLFFMMML